MSTPKPSLESIRSADGTMLSVRRWRGDQARAILVVSHGIGEHADCYAHVAEALTSAPNLVDVVGFDYRGHGSSEGRRGVVRSYGDLGADLRAVMEWAARDQPGLPRYVLAHSNGAIVALREVIADPSPFSGIVLSNPALRLRLKVPGHKRLIGQVLLRLAPGVTLSSALNDAMMIRDVQSLADRRLDALRHTRISAPLFFGMVDGGPWIVERADRIVLPTLLLLGGSDPLVDPEATLAFFDRLGGPDKTLRLYPEMLHEPLNDVGRDRVVADLASWLADQLDRSHIAQQHA